MLCCICHGKLKYCKKLHCGHMFCFKCIVDWEKINLSCPLCRTSIVKQHVWPMYCIACGTENCKSTHQDLDHQIIVEHDFCCDES